MKYYIKLIGDWAPIYFRNMDGISMGIVQIRLAIRIILAAGEK